MNFNNIALIALISVNALFGASAFVDPTPLSELTPSHELRRTGRRTGTSSDKPSLKERCIDTILKHPELREEYQALRQDRGEKRAAQRLINSFKGTSEPLTPMLPPLVYRTEQKEAPRIYEILETERQLFDQMKAFCISIDNSIAIDPEEAIRTCIQIGPERASSLLKKIILKYPKYRRGIFTYLKCPELHHQNFAFPFDPVLKSIDEAASISLIQFMGEQGYAPAKAHYVAHCLQKKAAQQKQDDEQRAFEAAQKIEEQQLKDAIRKKELAIAAEEKRKQREEEAKKQRLIKDERAYQQALKLIENNKYDDAHHILLDLSERGHKKAMIERGKIQQELMFKSIVTQATAAHTQARRTRRRGKGKEKATALQSKKHHRETALSLFEQAGTYGCYYTGKFYETMWHFSRDTHQALAKVAVKEAQKMKPIRSQQQLISQGLDAQRKAIAMWYNNPTNEQIEEAHTLAERATALYKKAAKQGDQRSWNHIAILHHQLNKAKSIYFRQKAKTAFHNVKNDDPNYAKSLTRLAYIYADEGWIEMSIQFLKNSCEIDPSYKQTLPTLSKLCHALLQRPIPAIAKVEDLTNFMITIGGPTAETWNLLAKCAALKTEGVKAIECYINAGECGSSTGWYHAGIIARAAGRIKDAKTCLTNACELNSKNTDALIELGHLYRDQCKYNRARQHYAAAANLGNAQAYFMTAQCYHYGWGGTYNIQIAHLHYLQSLQAELPPVEKRKRRILTQLTQMQDPLTDIHTKYDVGQTIQKMMKVVITTPVQDDDIDGKRLIAEAHYAQANLHLICVRGLQKEIAKNSTTIDQLKTDYVKNKECIAALVQKIVTDRKAISSNCQKALNELRATICGANDCRYQCAIAELLQQHFFPKTTLDNMTPEQQEYCNQALELYHTIIGNNPTSQSDCYFVFKARCNLSKMYRHLCHDSPHTKIIKVFSTGFEDDKIKCNISIAHAYEQGLLSTDGKPDYKNALMHIERACAINPDKQVLKKERAFYQYAANPSASLDTLDQAFILELNNRLNGRLLTVRLDQRLSAYNAIDFGSEDLLCSSGVDASGTPITYTRASTTQVQQIASSSSASSSSGASSSSSSK